MINDYMEHLTLKGVKHTVVFRPIGLEMGLITQAVEEMECVERDLRKLKELLNEGFEGSVSSMVDFIHTHGGAVTDRDCTYEYLIDFNYGYISATLEGEHTHFYPLWTLHKDIHIKMWDLPNIADLRTKYPITWDSLIEGYMPSGSTFKHWTSKADHKHPILQGFELCIME